MTYDAIGNPTDYRNGISFTWQNGRQLSNFSQGTTTALYTYDANGTRLTKTVNNVTYTYLYNGSQLLQETIGDQILDYSYDANGQIYAVCYRANANDEGTYYYYAHNTRGDIVGLYNADGTLHAKYSYDVWGNKLAVSDALNNPISSSTDIANIQPFRYRGYYYDYESGFYYLQSRYYDPVTHRFINADGLVSTGTGVLGYNMFAYCENNPVNQYDSDGLCGDPTCVKCNPFWREYISDPKNLAWNKKVNPNFKINDCSKKDNIYYNPITNEGYVSMEFTSNETAVFVLSGPAILHSTYRTINEINCVTLSVEGMPQLNAFDKAQWLGEIELHLYGYVTWDVANSLGITRFEVFGIKDSFDYLYEHCHTVELEYKNGSVNDTHSGNLGFMINTFSKTWGYLNYYVF